MKKDVEFRLVRFKIIYCRSLNLCFAYAHIPRPDHPRGQARSIETVTVRIKQQMPTIWIFRSRRRSHLSIDFRTRSFHIHLLGLCFGPFPKISSFNDLSSIKKISRFILPYRSIFLKLSKYFLTQKPVFKHGIIPLISQLELKLRNLQADLLEWM